MNGSQNDVCFIHEQLLQRFKGQVEEELLLEVAAQHNGNLSQCIDAIHEMFPALRRNPAHRHPPQPPSNSATTTTTNNTASATASSAPSPPNYTPATVDSQQFADLVALCASGQRVLICMRGLPGSGKSHAARRLVQAALATTSTTITSTPPLAQHIFSADAFFERADGSYRYDPRLLPNAHAECRRQVSAAAQLARSPIVVDNTAIRPFEAEPYAAIAARCGYQFRLLEPDTPWRHSPDECFRRTVHSVPLDKIVRMWADFQRHAFTAASLMGQFGAAASPAVPLMRQQPSPPPLARLQWTPKAAQLLAVAERKVTSSGGGKRRGNGKSPAAPKPAAPAASALDSPQRNRSTVVDSAQMQWAAASAGKAMVALLRDDPATPTPRPAPEHSERDTDPGPAHRPGCRNENAAFAALRSIHPNVVPALLWEYFVDCRGNAAWLWEMLSDSNGRVEFAAGQHRELQCRCDRQSREAQLAAFAAAASSPAPSCSEDSSSGGDSSNSDDDDDDDDSGAGAVDKTLDIVLGAELIEQLEQHFGAFVAGVHEAEPRSVLMPRRQALRLHRLRLRGLPPALGRRSRSGSNQRRRRPQQQQLAAKSGTVAGGLEEIVPHAVDCPLENRVFAEMRTVYPQVAAHRLWRLFAECEGDADWAVEKMLREDALSDSEDENTASGGEFNALQCDCFELLHTVDDAKAGPSTSSAAAAPRASTSTVAPIESLEIDLGLELCQQLDTTFGRPIPPTHPQYAHVRMPLQQVRDLYAVHIESMLSEQVAADLELAKHLQTLEIFNEPGELLVANSGVSVAGNHQQQQQQQSPQTEAASQRRQQRTPQRSQQRTALLEFGISSSGGDPRSAAIVGSSGRLTIGSGANSAFASTSGGSSGSGTSAAPGPRPSYTLRADSPPSVPRSQSRSPPPPTAAMAAQHTAATQRLCQLYPELEPQIIAAIYRMSRHNAVQCERLFAEHRDRLRRDGAEYWAAECRRLPGTEMRMAELREIDERIFPPHQTGRISPADGGAVAALLRHPLQLPEHVKLMTREENLRLFADTRNVSRRYAKVAEYCYQQAVRALDAGQPQRCVFYTRAAQLNDIKTQRCNQYAATYIVQVHEYFNRDPFLLDVHYMLRGEAKEALDMHIDRHVAEIRQRWESRRVLHIITGRGLHSYNNVPVLKLATLERLRRRAIRVSEVNQGMLRIVVQPATLLTTELGETYH